MFFRNCVKTTTCHSRSQSPRFVQFGHVVVMFVNTLLFGQRSLTKNNTHTVTNMTIKRTLENKINSSLMNFDFQHAFYVLALGTE